MSRWPGVDVQVLCFLFSINWGYCQELTDAVYEADVQRVVGKDADDACEEDAYGSCEEDDAYNEEGRDRPMSDIELMS